MKELQKNIKQRIDCAKADVLEVEQSDYKYNKQVSILTAHRKGYLLALEHIKVLIDDQVETEQIWDDILAEQLLQLESEGFKHDFPTR